MPEVTVLLVTRLALDALEPSQPTVNSATIMLLCNLTVLVDVALRVCLMSPLDAVTYATTLVTLVQESQQATAYLARVLMSISLTTNVSVTRASRYLPTDSVEPVLTLVLLVTTSESAAPAKQMLSRLRPMTVFVTMASIWTVTETVSFAALPA